MNLLLPYQRFIACSDGLIRGDSSKDHLPDGTPYWVRQIDGPPMPGTFVLVVARRGWMGPNKRLVKNFIVKKVESIEVSSIQCSSFRAASTYSYCLLFLCYTFYTGRWPCCNNWD